MKIVRCSPRLRGVALAGSVLAFTTGASAAPPSEGEVLFREGRAAMQDRDYDRACTKFAESQKKEPAPGTALNLGECEERRGHLVAASEAFATAASTFTSADKQKYATSRAEAMDKRVPRLTVRTNSHVTGLTVRVGSRSIALDSEVKLDPGDVVVHAEAPGYRPKDLKATLREGKSLEVDLGTLDPEGSPVPLRPGETRILPPQKSKEPDLRIVGLGIGGAGVAALIVGGVTGLLALDKASTVEDRCDPNLACDQEGFDAAQSGDTLSLVSTISVIVGAAAIIGGGTLYYMATRKKSASITRGGFVLRF
jgi:hypothetical protein